MAKPNATALRRFKSQIESFGEGELSEFLKEFSEKVFK